mmetsp:Transcript_25009/g.99386  ORF Transcript_25009/g.99386 Transcript_25009/m.99386 type:complete len:216 (+) Transcript_25009:552-1199(+)
MPGRTTAASLSEEAHPGGAPPTAVRKSATGRAASWSAPRRLPGWFAAAGGVEIEPESSSTASRRSSVPPVRPARRSFAAKAARSEGSRWEPTVRSDDPRSRAKVARSSRKRWRARRRSSVLVAAAEERRPLISGRPAAAAGKAAEPRSSASSAHCSTSWRWARTLSVLSAPKGGPPSWASSAAKPLEGSVIGDDRPGPNVWKGSPAPPIMGMTWR